MSNKTKAKNYVTKYYLPITVPIYALLLYHTRKVLPFFFTLDQLEEDMMWCIYIHAHLLHMSVKF